METVIDPNNKHGRCIQITKMDAEEQRKVEADRDKLEFDDLDSAVGFAKVIKKISESRKPVIGKRHIAALVYFFPMKSIAQNILNQIARNPGITYVLLKSS